MKPVVIVVSCVIAVILLIWSGLKVKPNTFAAVTLPATEIETVPLPPGLPVPVERFYRQVYGDRVPVIASAVITGRGTMRLKGITFPARFRFTHQAGQAYRHYFELTFFGLPIMKANEHFLEGHGRLNLPFGVVEGPKVDQGGNLALWAESVWLPSIWITDPRVQWEPIDEVTALLVVPFGESRERFVVRFDPKTHLPQLFESMRYRDPADEAKILWLNEALQWGSVNDTPTLITSAVTWFDERTPWITLTIDNIVYNRDVSEYVRANGP